MTKLKHCIHSLHLFDVLCATFSLLHSVQNFFKSSPDRNQVTSADRIALLQLKTRGEISGRTLEEEFERNRAKLMEGIDLPVLLPALKEREVLSAEEAQKLTSEQPPLRNKQLLEMARSKGALGLLGLLECLRENPEHKELANLFEASPGPGRTREQKVLFSFLTAFIVVCVL